MTFFTPRFFITLFTKALGFFDKKSVEGGLLLLQLF